MSTKEMGKWAGVTFRASFGGEKSQTSWAWRAPKSKNCTGAVRAANIAKRWERSGRETPERGGELLEKREWKEKGWSKRDERRDLWSFFFFWKERRWLAWEQARNVRTNSGSLLLPVGFQEVEGITSLSPGIVSGRDHLPPRSLPPRIQLPCYV